MNPVTFRLFRQEVRGHSTFNDSLPHTIDPILQRLRLDRHGWCDLVSESYTEVARMLIEAGLDVSVHYPKVGTAFDFANIMGREEIAKLIASKTTVDPEGRGHNTVTPDPL